MAEEVVSGLRGAIKSKHAIEAIELIPSGGGVFDVELDGEVIFSKSRSGRHANQGEVLKLIQDKLS